MELELELELALEEVLEVAEEALVVERELEEVDGLDNVETIEVEVVEVGACELVCEALWGGPCDCGAVR
jgi:hypothetical protein